MKKIKGVIFDLDGTLLSSTDVWRKIDVEFLGKRGLEVPEDYVETITPMEFKQIADYTIERFHLPETPEAVMDEWNTMAKDAYENKVQIKPGVKELLTALKKGNIPMAVATSNIEALYKPCLKRNGILEYFDAFTECGEVGRGKSFPDIYIRSAEKLGCRPEECAVFEDIIMALETAGGVGFTTVCVRDEAWDYSPEQINLVADYEVQEISQALSLIKQWI